MDNDKWQKYLKFGGPRSGACSPRLTQKALDEFIPKLTEQSWVLDAGAGTMEYSKKFLEMGHWVVAADINSERDDEGYDGRFIARKFDMHDNPYKNSCFDLVFCNHAFEHLLAPFIVMLEFNRVLKMNGYLFIGTPDHTARWVKDYNSGHLSVPTKIQMEGWAEESGFQLEKYVRESEGVDGKDDGGDDMMQLFLFKKIKEVEI